MGYLMPKPFLLKKSHSTVITINNLLERGDQTKQLCSVMNEGHVIKYVNKFSGGLKRNKEFNIILF